jgi:hypothetical protein
LSDGFILNGKCKEREMRIRTKLYAMAILLTGFISSANATTINFSIDNWNVGYGPFDTVYINLNEVDGRGHATLLFHRDRLPEDLVDYVSRSNLPKVHYSIEEFSNVLELLNTSKIKSFHFSDDSGINHAALLVQH